MSSETFYEVYEKLFVTLRGIIKDSEQRVIRDDPDSLFLNNTNFFIKSYLINICTYLESYLQDIAFMYACELDERVKCADIPHNFVYWRTAKEIKEKELEYKNADLSVTKEMISDNLSGNPGKTIRMFRYLGLDIKYNAGFKEYADMVGSVVTKRNNIVHHNDNATDISFSDLLSYIEVFLKYMKSIDVAVSGKSKKTATTHK